MALQFYSDRGVSIEVICPLGAAALGSAVGGGGVLAFGLGLVAVALALALAAGAALGAALAELAAEADALAAAPASGSSADAAAEALAAGSAAPEVQQDASGGATHCSTRELASPWRITSLCSLYGLASPQP